MATSTTQDGVSVILGAEGLDIIDFFDFRICGDEVKKSKPDPEIYQRVKGFFGETLNYLVFEDAASGVAAARGAAMSCIAVPNRFTIQQEGLALATHVITDLTQKAQLVRCSVPLCGGAG